MSWRRALDVSALQEEPTRAGGLLLPSHRQQPMQAVRQRGLVALACIVLATAVVWLQRADYYDASGNPITLLDALYFSTVSLSTTGYGDIVPLTTWARLSNILLITPLRLIFLIVLVGSTLEILTTRTRSEYRERRWRKSVRDHTVVIGFGTKGQAAVQTLIDNGIPAAQIIAICPDSANVELATQMGCAGIVGDGRTDRVLRDAEVEGARHVVIATDSDDTTVLITLAVRRLAPDVTIIVAAREMIHAPAMQQSGASAVIPTAEAAGRIMALSLLAPAAGAIASDLIDPRDDLRVVQRTVEPEEVGSGISGGWAHGEVVLAVVRGDHIHRFDEGDIGALEPGDSVVVVKHGPIVAP